MQARVYLAPKGGRAALAAAVAAVSTPGSASYHNFLTSAQYAARFSAPTAAVDAVSHYLRSAGLKVTDVEAHNRYVTVCGTVAAADKAFGTSIDRYQHGSARPCRRRPPRVKCPAALASRVLTVAGLDTPPTRRSPPRTRRTAPPAGFRNARPCSRYYGQLAGHGPGGLQDAAAEVPRQDAAVRAVRLHRPAVPRRLRGQHRLDGTGVTRRRSPTPTPRRPSPRTPTRTPSQPRRRRLRGRPVHPDPAGHRSTDKSACGRPAGTARRPSTSRPCTPWHPARRSATTRRRAATTTTSSTRSRRSWTRTASRSSRTPGATPSEAASTAEVAAYEQSSCRAPSRASASCSPPVTTVTSWPTPASSRPTTRPPTRT